MDFGLFSFDRLLLIGLIAVIVVGPERLPRYAEGLARLVRRAGDYARDTKTRMRDEIGPEIDEVDWRKLDPRQYDPRRIIRDALFEEPSVTAASVAPAVAGATVAAAAVSTSQTSGPRSVTPRPSFSRENPPPFDTEAT